MAFQLIQIDITDECPLYCSHCSNSSGPNKKRYLPAVDIERVLRQATLVGIKDFVISGGEPLRHPEVELVVRASARLGFSSMLFTTGIRDNRKRAPVAIEDWKGLLDAGLKSAVFSIYSGPGNRDFHNEIVRLKPVGWHDAFEVNEAAMSNAISAGLRTELQFIPSDRSSFELEDVFKWGMSLGCERLHLQYPTEQGRNQIFKSLAVSSESELRLRAMACNLCDKEPDRFHISRMWRSKWQLGSPNSECAQIIVRSDGAAFPCNACKYLGSTTYRRTIYEGSLENICADEKWQSSCGCSDRYLRQATPAGEGSSVHILRPHELFTASTK